MGGTRVAVIGAGIVGLAVAYHLVRSDAKVTVIDRDPEGDKASLGNAGGIAVTEVVPASAQGSLWRVFAWMLDPLGPLTVRPTYAPKLIPWLARFARTNTSGEIARISQALGTINARVYDDLVPMLNETGLARELHRSGALFVYESEKGYRRDAAEWACKRAHGVETQEMTGALARELEPDLGPIVHSAVLTPQWSYVSDPRTIVEGLREWLLSNGVSITRGEVHTIAAGSAKALLVESDVCQLTADSVVIAAGAWSGLLARRLGDRVLLESERGYNMTLPKPGIVLKHQLIFAERKFVATPLACGLRIGGAAEFGGLAAVPNFKRSQTLVELARQYLPNLSAERGVSWAGHRPTTPDSLPVIGRSGQLPNVFYAFGHGHLGLTQAATTGRLVSELVFNKPTTIDLSQYSIERFN